MVPHFQVYMLWLWILWTLVQHFTLYIYYAHRPMPPNLFFPGHNQDTSVWNCFIFVQSFDNPVSFWHPLCETVNHRLGSFENVFKMLNMNQTHICTDWFRVIKVGCVLSSKFGRWQFNKRRSCPSQKPELLPEGGKKSNRKRWQQLLWWTLTINNMEI